MSHSAANDNRQCRDRALAYLTELIGNRPHTVTVTGGGVSVQGMKTGVLVTAPLVDTTPVVVPAA